MKKRHLVVWHSYIDGDTPTESAQNAVDKLRDPQSTALVFSVSDGKVLHEIDLLKGSSTKMVTYPHVLTVQAHKKSNPLG